MGVTVGPRLARFAEERIPALMGTVRRDGSVQLTPVWFEYRDGFFWLNGGPGRDWLRHIRRDPQRRVTLLLIDPKNMWRWAQIQGRVVAVTEEGARDHIDRLSQRYLGRAYARRGDERVIVKVEPLRITGRDAGGTWQADEERGTASA